MKFRITDGTEATISARDVDTATTEYIQDYGFNEPGEVECVVYDNDDCAIRKFVIRSDDGRRSKLGRVYAPDRHGNWWVQEQEHAHE